MPIYFDAGNSDTIIIMLNKYPPDDPRVIKLWSEKVNRQWWILFYSIVFFVLTFISLLSWPNHTINPAIQIMAIGFVFWIPFYYFNFTCPKCKSYIGQRFRFINFPIREWDNRGWQADRCPKCMVKLQDSKNNENNKKFLALISILFLLVFLNIVYAFYLGPQFWHEIIKISI